MKTIRKRGGFKYEKWDLLGYGIAGIKDSRSIGGQNIIERILKNRDINGKREKKEFFKPTNPLKFKAESLGLKGSDIRKIIRRLKIAEKNNEKVIVYGDYDADGICATAILWETLYSLGLDASPHIPERFSEGYGLNVKSVKNLKLKDKNLKLIITVDNGIVANEAVSWANKAGIDVIITDHHQKGKIVPDAYSTLQTDKICGSAIAWVLSREVVEKLKGEDYKQKAKIKKSLELAAIGTVADQMPLIGVNRSFAKYGIEQLRKSERLGLLSLLETAGVKKSDIGTYEINYVIAPRLNAMGRLVHAIDSLRLLCTKDSLRARDLARILNNTNRDRQRIVDEVVLHAKKSVDKNGFGNVIVLAHESYHEGVIGLAAGKLVEEYYRPSIVFAKGSVLSKASARSIPGFNIIEAIRKFKDLIEDGGGHPMAAGFTIKTQKIKEFKNRFEEEYQTHLTDKILSKKLNIDSEIDFTQLSFNIINRILEFEPTGIGNPKPLFITKQVKVINSRLVGQTSKHLKLILEEGGKRFNAIAFNFGDYSGRFSVKDSIDVVYNISKNVWNGNENIELSIRDMRVNG